MIIDKNKLLNTLHCSDIVNFREWYNNTLNELCRQKELPTEKFWSSSFAVGSSEWFKNMTLLPDSVDKYVECVNENSNTYIINPPQSVLVNLWKKLKNK